MRKRRQNRDGNRGSNCDTVSNRLITGRSSKSRSLNCRTLLFIPSVDNRSNRFKKRCATELIMLLSSSPYPPFHQPTFNGRLPSVNVRLDANVEQRGMNLWDREIVGEENLFHPCATLVNVIFFINISASFQPTYCRHCRCCFRFRTFVSRLEERERERRGGIFIRV